MTDRAAFRSGVDALLDLQHKLGRPPKRKYINSYVRHLVHRAELQHDSRRRYFELLATCALLGKESMYNQYQPKRRK